MPLAALRHHRFNLSRATRCHAHLVQRMLWHRLHVLHRPCRSHLVATHVAISVVTSAVTFEAAHERAVDSEDLLVVHSFRTCIPTGCCQAKLILTASRDHEPAATPAVVDVSYGFRRSNKERRNLK